MYLLILPLPPSPLPQKDLIHGALIGKPVASRAKVTAVYVEEDGTEINFTRTYVRTYLEYAHVTQGRIITHFSIGCNQCIVDKVIPLVNRWLKM